MKPWTARFHKRNLFRKLQARSTIEMLLRAQERGWLPPTTCKNL